VSQYEQTVQESVSKKSELESQVDYQKEQASATSDYDKDAQALNATFDSVRALLSVQNDSLEVAVSKTTDAVAQCLAEKDNVSALESKWVLLDEAHRSSTVIYETLAAGFNALSENANLAKDNALKELLSKSESNISTEDLKEFRDTFDFFDKQKDGHLSPLDFYGVLTALGETPTEDSAARVFATIDHDGSGQINFDEFSKFMIARRKDSDTQSQLTDSFNAVSGGSDFITEDQLKLILPADQLSQVISKMPVYLGSDGTPLGFDFKAWLSAAYN